MIYAEFAVPANVNPNMLLLDRTVKSVEREENGQCDFTAKQGRKCQQAEQMGCFLISFVASVTVSVGKTVHMVQLLLNVPLNGFEVVWTAKWMLIIAAHLLLTC